MKKAEKDYCAECVKMAGCKPCRACANTEDDVCDVCQYDVSKCKWYFDEKETP